MAIGGSPTSRRITAWHHTCCNTIRWSGQRVCDLCGTRADFRCDGVPIYILMERLHAEDKQKPVDAPAQCPPAAPPAQSPAPAPSPASSGSSVPAQIAGATREASPVAGNPTPAAVRPPGARPHGHEDDEGRPAPLARRIPLADRRIALHTMWLAGATSLLSALFAVESVGRGQDPLLLLLIAVAASLVVVFAPVRVAVVPGEVSR